MELRGTQIVEADSRVLYNYSAIRITQSRIDKGLIAIPRSLAKSMGVTAQLPTAHRIL